MASSVAEIIGTTELMLGAPACSGHQTRAPGRMLSQMFGDQVMSPGLQASTPLGHTSWEVGTRGQLLL